MNRSSLRATAAGAVVWLVPPAILWTIYFAPRAVIAPASAVTYLVAIAVVLVAMRRPDRCLLVLVVAFPFQGLLLAELYAAGAPASIVHHLGAWKEVLALAVMVAGARRFVLTGQRADALDRLALAFVAICALYAVFQASIVPGAPAPTGIRLLGFRETAGFVLLLLGARHVGLGDDFAYRAGRVVLFTGTIVAAVGIFEAIDSSSWNQFVVRTVQYPRYEQDVLGNVPANPNDIRIYGTVGGAQLVRIGSVFLDELALSWYLILPLAVGVERIVRGRASGRAMVATLAIGAALLLTQTRSAILAGVVVILLTLPYAAGRGRHWQVRAALVIAVLAMLAIPTAFATGVSTRVEGAANGTDQSTSGHLGGFFGGLRTIGQHPLGLGLATGAGTGQRFAVTTDLIPENNYLEVGDELGVIPMAVFVLLTVTLLVWLRRAARHRGPPMLTAAWSAGAGLAIAAFFLQTWSSFPVAWTFWGVAGATLGPAMSQTRAHAMSRAHAARVPA